MPVIEIYLPDPELIRRYFCGWLVHIWRRLNTQLFLHELTASSTFSSSSSSSTNNSNGVLGRLLLVVATIAFFSVDWASHFRTIATFLFCYFRYPERQPLLSSFRDYSMCWLNDVHFSSTITSGRLIRECLFARYRLLLATRLTETASGLGVHLSVGSVHLVTQHPLHVFTPFVVDTRVVAFDAKAIFIEHRIARLRDEVTVGVLLATQIVQSDGVTIFDILRHLDWKTGSRPSPLPSPAVRACALVEAEIREMLRKEMEMCRMGWKFWDGSSEDRISRGHETAAGPNRISKAARQLCLQERLRIAAEE